jgi:hypothetical protein
MSLYVLTVESSVGCEVVGAYLNEKAAKAAAAEFVEKQEGLSFKKKLVKKDSEESKKLLFLEDSKEAEKKSLFMSSVAFELPVSSGGAKAKKVKDPNAPKKGMSAFMIFSNEQRNKIKAANPEASFGEIGRKVGEAWKALSDKQKQVYVKKSEEDKKRYESEFQTYTDAQTTAA